MNQIKKTRYLLFIFTVILFSCEKPSFKIPSGSAIVTETAPEKLNNKEIPDTRDVLRYIVKNSKKSVYLCGLYYNYDCDAELLKLIKKKAANGVKIQMLISESPSSRDQLYRADLDLQTNIDVKFFDITSYGQNPYGALHAKYVIVDERIALLGSANFSYPALNNNREINILITDDKIVKKLTEIFKSDYIIAGLSSPLTNRSFFMKKDKTIFSTTNRFLLLESAPWQMDNPYIVNIEDAITNLIYQAKDCIEAEIYLYTAAITNNPWMERALFNALERKIKVRIIANKETFDSKDDLGLYRYPIYRDAIKRLAEKGAEVKLIDTSKLVLKETFSTTHSKIIITDKRFCIISTANWTPTSITENREVAIFSSDPDIVNQLEKIFKTDWDFSSFFISN